MTPASHDPEFDNWPVQGREDADVAYVGMAGESETDPVRTGAGVAGQVFYDPEADTLFGADIDRDAGEVVPRPDAEWSVDPGESLGEAIERLGEETGWEALSEFAQEHLESESDE